MQMDLGGRAQFNKFECESNIRYRQTLTQHEGNIGYIGMKFIVSKIAGQQQRRRETKNKKYSSLCRNKLVITTRSTYFRSYIEMLDLKRAR